MKGTADNKFALGDVACSPHSLAQLLDELRVLLGDQTIPGRTILCVNAHIYNLAARDAALRRRLNAARICSADGMAIVWAARLFGVHMNGRCNMTEAFHAFLADKAMPRSKAILIGCKPEEATRAAAEIQARSSHCRVMTACSGFLSDEEYRSIFARHANADLILIGRGSPQSESLAELAAELCPRAVVWHIGGGTIRILAGTMPEAPVVWRRTGMQWLYRLAHDPAGLWRRYLMGNPMFAARMLLAGVRGRIGKHFAS